MYLKEFREKLNLTQKQFSERLGIAQSAIARYENNKVAPTSTVIFKYIEKLNANPNFLYLGIEPLLLDKLPKLSMQNINLLNDLTLMLTQEQIHDKLNMITMDEIISKFENKRESVLIKLLEIVRLDEHIRVTPFLFLYYIFQIIAADTKRNEVIDYKEYLAMVITNYKVFAWKNQPLFTQKIKTETVDFLDVKLTEEECKILVKNYKNTLELLENKMTPLLIKLHRDTFKNSINS